jgi:competence protein ComEC
MELVQVAAPQLAVISCGFENTFGFPHPGVMARWQQTGAQVLRIDEIGAVTVEVTPAGELTWHSEVSTASGW